MSAERETIASDGARKTEEARPRALVELLREWRENGDAEEQGATMTFLRAALDEDRHSTRTLFP